MKKIYLLCVWLLVVAGVAYAQEFNYYYNHTNGWTGEASIKYIGIDKDGTVFDEVVEERLPGIMADGARARGYKSFKPIKKLTERDWWLVWSALGEYSVANEEIYALIIKKGRGELIMVTKIQNNGQSINWVAYELY